MHTAAILPVKRFAHAKRRLGTSVADPLRTNLARAMVGDVLVALHGSVSIAQTIVVTREDSIAAAARYQGALVVEDTAEDGQSTAVALGVERALAEGFERVLCIPGDCPALDPAELDSLLNGSGSETVIVPDRHGKGTNGLLLTPPDVFPVSFGPDSFARHRQLARDAGVDCRVERPPSLLLDIDTGEDLAVLRKRLASGSEMRAARTRRMLDVSQSAGNPRTVTPA